MQIEILYQDDDMLMVNKPAGILVIPDRFNSDLPSLNRLLESKLGHRIWVVHRLDRDTSGVMCFAKNEEMHRYLSQLFEAHDVGKFYAGIVMGRVLPEEGRIEAAIIEHPTQKGKMTTARKGKASVTDYKVVEQWALHSLVQFQIHTGRTHQIRVHMTHIGHPLVGDQTYSNTRRRKLPEPYASAVRDFRRQALHAVELHFISPKTNEMLQFGADLPQDMRELLEQLETH